VGTDDPEELACAYGEVHVSKRLVLLVSRPPERIGEVLLKAAAWIVRDRECLRDPVCLDRVLVHYASSANLEDSRRWSLIPVTTTVVKAASGARWLPCAPSSCCVIASGPSTSERASWITCTRGLNAMTCCAHIGRIETGYMIGVEKKSTDE